jgi:transcriptional regulator with XRE-family HTH domain
LTVNDLRSFDKSDARYPAEMTDFGPADSLGERIQAVRKARGMSVRELALAIGGNPSQATIENIEIGRKASIDVVQLLNIAMALKVPLVYLLVPVGHPDQTLALSGLSPEFASMTIAEFDAWLAGLPDGAHRAASLDERSATAELEALRLWKRFIDEAARLSVAIRLEEDALLDAPTIGSSAARLEEAQRAANRQLDFLRSAGWPL